MNDIVARHEQQVDNLSLDETAVATALPAVVVGIGVSASCLASFERLVAGIDRLIGAAYLVAVRQDEGLNVGTVLEALKRLSSLPVIVPTDGEKLEPNHIYVGGADDLMTLEGGLIRTRPATQPVGHRGTIDSMLISLAEHAQDRAVTVVLAGLGTDGTAGVTANKKFGGLSIAEQPPGVSAASLGGTGPSDVMDLHLPVDDIAAAITVYAGGLLTAADSATDKELHDQIEDQVKQITTLLRNVTGHDFHGYKRGTFIRRVQRRMHVKQIESIGDYVAQLRDSHEEVQNLFQDLLIGVTQFFRDAPEFEALEREIPRLFEGKEPDEQVRVWVLGCATGEEAYSIAILLREHMATLAQPPNVQIFATDLDARALNLARAGRYTDAIADHIRPDRLQRWFVREGDTYCVAKELREICIFSPHNIVKDAPFSRVDILSCRNLLIYLNSDLQSRVIPIFHFSLRPGGLLFLGSTENVTRHQKLFEPIDRKNRLFRRLEPATRVVPDFPLTYGVRVPEIYGVPAQTLPVSVRLTATMNRQAEAVAERYAPAYVVVDAQYDVLHFSGRTGRYLEPSAGAATLNLISLVHRDLRPDLRSALHRAVSEGRRIEVPRQVVHVDDRAHGLNLVVEPIGDQDVGSFVVLFQDTGLVPEAGELDPYRLVTDEHVQRLETELRVTRDRLQAVIEELESTNEELKSSNEEYQSINEELQSINEEMETSKEEVQSVNEELQTVNGELSHRVLELRRANSDLKNLLEATQIATVFLDNDLRVRSFTPAATEVFRLLETDVGRPLGHVVSRVHYPELLDEVRRVLKTLVPVEREVMDVAANRRFAARILPYRSIDNYISGAVITLTDLTAIYEAETARRASEERLRQFGEASQDILWIRDGDSLQWSYLTPAFEIIYGLSCREALAGDNYRSWQELILADDRPAVLEAINRVKDGEHVTFEYRIRRPSDGQVRWLRDTGFPMRDEAGRVKQVGGIGQDVTALKAIATALTQSEGRLRALVEGMSQLVWRARQDGGWIWASPQWTAFTGQAEADSHDFGWLDPVHPDDRKIALDAWARATETRGFEAEYRILNDASGDYRWFQTRAAPQRDDQGDIVEWLGTSTDVHQLKALQESQAVMVAELQHRTRNLIAVVCGIADDTMEQTGPTEAFRVALADRLSALSRVQGLLSRAELEPITLADVVHLELDALGAHALGDRIEVAGPDVWLRNSAVQTLALALHELATNARKYGALSHDRGQLSVTWSEIEIKGEGRLVLEWVETGLKHAPNRLQPSSQGSGYGRELIEQALPHALGARTTYALTETGVRCSIDLPSRPVVQDGEPQ